MGYCYACKRRTNAFCFVHKKHICESCLAQPGAGRCEANCYVKQYRQWIEDASFDNPPRCAHCNRSLTADAAQLFRLPCYCVFHKTCVTEVLERAFLVSVSESKAASSAGGVAASLRCPSCAVPLESSGAGSNPLVQATWHLAKSIEARVAKERDDYQPPEAQVAATLALSAAGGGAGAGGGGGGEAVSDVSSRQRSRAEPSAAGSATAAGAGVSDSHSVRVSVAAEAGASAPTAALSPPAPRKGRFLPAGARGGGGWRPKSFILGLVLIALIVSASLWMISSVRGAGGGAGSRGGRPAATAVSAPARVPQPPVDDAFDLQPTAGAAARRSGRAASDRDGGDDDSAAPADRFARSRARRQQRADEAAGDGQAEVM